MVAEWQQPDVSYRESLSANQDPGVPVFSPRCNPSFVAALRQSESQEDIRWGVPKVPPITPALPGVPTVEQYTDKLSARNFSLDPTYAQRANAPNHTLPVDVLPQPSNADGLALYHKLKSL